MKTSDFDYELPEALIAQEPLRQRDQCKLCVVHRASDQVEHRRFLDLPQLLRRGDLLVLNDSKVVKARIPCRREGSDGAVEVFLLEPPGITPESRFRVFFKPARKARPGERLIPVAGDGRAAFKVIEQGAEEPGLVEWDAAQGLDAAGLESLGVVPLPPYIKRERIPSADAKRIDSRYYQSIFAREAGSAAAPTASLHFTQRLFARLAAAGIEHTQVTLHVGAGTFLPVKTPTLEEHRMHRESYHLSQQSIDAIRQAKQQGRRIIPVGTTALRVLESAFTDDLAARAGWAETDIFIKPGYTFKVADALITNFHQPASTLIALISAFYQKDKVLDIYRNCIARNYRFLSYGDAMLLI